MRVKLRVSFVVSFELPEGATRTAAKEYVEDAVCVWAGALKPPCIDEEDPSGNPMFELNKDSVEVTVYRRV